MPGADLSLGWTEHMDDETKLPYYFHAATGQSTWDRPQPPKAFPTPPPLRRPDTPPPVSALTDRATKAVTQHQVAPGSTGNAASVAASLTAAFAGAGRPSHALWDDNAFVDLFLDGYRDHQRHALTKSFAKDAVALLEGAAIGAADDWRTHLGTGDKYVAVLSAYQAIKELGDTSQMLPTGSKSEQQLLELIQLVTMKVRSLSVGAFAFIPCGWITASDSFALLIVVQRTAADELSLTVCNTGPDGLQYHPIKVDVESSPNMLYRLSFVIPNIPSHRLHDSAFWLMLFRMQVWPADTNGVELLYEKLLPFLNGKPLAASQAANSQGNVLTSDWRPPPQAGDPSCVHLVLEAASLLLVRSGLSDGEVRAWESLVKGKLGALILQDLERVKGQIPSETSLRVCGIASQGIALCASRAAEGSNQILPVRVLQEIQQRCSQ